MADCEREQFAYRWVDDTLVLCIAVQPRSSNNAMVCIHGQQIKIRLTAPPVEGKANQLLIKQLAQWFKVPVSQVFIAQGGNFKTQNCARQTTQNSARLYKNPLKNKNYL